MAKPRSVKKGQVILYQGEASVEVYAVVKGAVKAYAVLDSGSEAVVAIYGPGDYFPISFDYDKATVSLFFHETMNDGEIVAYNSAEFKSLEVPSTENSKDLSKIYISSLLQINALIQADAYKKLAHTLRYLAMRFGAKMPAKDFTKIDIKLTQQDIAELCNMSRETTNLELTKLKQKNAIMEQAKYYLVNLRCLNKIIGDELDTTLEIKSSH